MKYDIYTDGACSGNPGPGGAAAILITGDKILHRVGRGYKKTTNNRMEIKAVTYGAKAILKRIKEPSEIVFHTDSQLVYGAIALGWKKNANRDLWTELEQVLASLESIHQIRFQKVAGHSADKWNNCADALAVKLRQMPAETLLEDTRYEEIQTNPASANDRKPFTVALDADLAQLVQILTANGEIQKTRIDDVVNAALRQWLKPKLTLDKFQTHKQITSC